MATKYIAPSGVKRYLSDYWYGIRAVLEGTWTGGIWQERFIAALHKFTRTTSVTLVNSGSSANLAAMSAGVAWARINHPRATRVIACAANFPTTVNPIEQCGCEPVFVDAMPNSFAPDLVEITALLRDERVLGAIIAVPLGRDFDVLCVQERESGGIRYDINVFDELVNCARTNHKFVIFDACDAIYFMTLVPAGRYPVMTTYSFYPAHHVTTGEGGAVASYDMALHRLVKQFSTWGRGCICAPGQDNACGHRFDQQWGGLPLGYDHKYVYNVKGYNLKMTDISAAIGCSQLRHFRGRDRFVKNLMFTGILKDARLPDFFNYEIMQCLGVAPFGSVVALQPQYGHLLPKLIQHLESHGIGTRRYFGGNLLRQPAYYDPKEMGRYPNADYLTECVCWVGCHDRIRKKDIKYMADTILEFAKENK